ncbi:Nickel uptake substrate-specific transmembrane region [Pirellula sp. SH-Sr6A]|uniref:DUF4198 domain-containing protein n=1 Tax=Pirellula sp. SH-Sr6A TaxID=1632865 RepID=UPI00078D3E68|nr:DUF4198 domain-containing protein [Pirellula sp. SH-Sr6A]AMV34988.1 Nickel uptake substrate-specific transmembrane region [Pirellula sp. SH-Sr6A]
MKKLFLAVWLMVSGAVPFAGAHDTWVQSGPLVARYQDVVHIDLMLGNHGNNHRDFKLASKITLDPCTLELIQPDGSKMDLKGSAIDMGSAPKEGFWSSRFVTKQLGVHQVVHTLDMLHGTTRAIKTGKTYFIASNSFGSVPKAGSDQIQPLNKGLELVLEGSLESIAANRDVKLRVLWHGKPLPQADVAFVPRGATLAEGKDSTYEKTSDANGFVSFRPMEGNYLLAVVHHVATDERGEGYDKTHYGATLVLPIPHVPLQ